MQNTPSALTKALEGIDALSISVLGQEVELQFNSYENDRNVNRVVVSPCGTDLLTGESTYTVRAYRAARHAGETLRMRAEKPAVFACSLREVVESVVWS